MRSEGAQYTEKTHKIIARMAKEIVCETYGVPHARMLADGRGDIQAAQARQAAMYLAHVVGQMTLSEISKAFRRNRSTVSHACIHMEDRRDSPIFNLQVEYMEKRLRARIDDYFERAIEAGRPLLKEPRFG